MALRTAPHHNNRYIDRLKYAPRTGCIFVAKKCRDFPVEILYPILYIFSNNRGPFFNTHLSVIAAAAINTARAIQRKMKDVIGNAV